MHDRSTSVSRREFLIGCLAGGTAALLAPPPRLGFGPVGANDRLRVGVIGLGNAGLENLRTFLRLPNIQIAALCDVREAKLRTASALVCAGGQAMPFLSKEHRHLADLADLDAVSIAVPPKQRLEMALDYCDAGKEVMLERPFSQTAVMGVSLVEAAETGGRIVQQKDDSLPFSSSDDLSTFGLTAIGPVRSVTGRKSFGYASVEASLAELPGMAWADLDLARCIVGGDVPSTLSVRQTARFGPGRQRIVIDAEYSIAEKRVNVEFELNAAGNSPMTDIRFTGASGNLVVSTDSISDDVAKMASFANFAACVRDRTPHKLINPVREARKSNFLVELAKTSIEERTELMIDRVTERVSSGGVREWRSL